MSIKQTWFLLSIGIKHSVEFPHTKTQEELEVSVLILELKVQTLLASDL